MEHLQDTADLYAIALKGGSGDWLEVVGRMLDVFPPLVTLEACLRGSGLPRSGGEAARLAVAALRPYWAWHIIPGPQGLRPEGAHEWARRTKRLMPVVPTIWTMGLRRWRVLAGILDGDLPKFRFPATTPARVVQRAMGYSEAQGQAIFELACQRGVPTRSSGARALDLVMRELPRVEAEDLLSEIASSLFHPVSEHAAAIWSRLAPGERLHPTPSGFTVHQEPL